MLQAEKVTFQYLGADRPSVVDADVAFSDGAVNLLWGDNGAGKSTLALILCGAIPHLIKGAMFGRVLWNGSPLSEDLTPKLSSFVFQNPQTYFQGYTLEEEVWALSGAQGRLARYVNALLPDVSPDTPLQNLSLGQQQRVALCSAALRPTPLLFLDEPFESLDDAGAAQAAELIETAADSGRNVVIIQRPQRREVTFKCHKSYAVSEGKVLEGFPQPPEPIPPIAQPPLGDATLTIDNLSFSYSKWSGTAVNGANLSVSEGEAVGLIGPNGSGKTTLFLLASGLLKPSDGCVLVGGRRLTGKELRSQVKCSFQNPDAQLFGTTVEEELTFGLRRGGLSGRDIRTRLERAGDLLPFNLSADPFNLSYGQKKLLAIITTFILEPKVIVLDEPTAGLDYKNIMILHRLAEDFLGAGGAILISSHSLPEVRALSHRLLVMEGGGIREDVSSGDESASDL